jgi:hypothetical protein
VKPTNKLIVLAVLLLTTTCGVHAQSLWRNTFRTRTNFNGPAANTSSVTQNQNAPGWTLIEGTNQPMDYNLYWAPYPTNANPCTGWPYNCEITGFTGDNAATPYGTLRVRPPTSYYFINNTSIGLESSFGPCSALAGSNPPPASMFTISQPFWNAKGLVMQGYVGGGSYAVGSPAGSYALAVAYVSSNRCSAGDQEYGFFWDTTRPDQALVFYYSQYTNTPSQMNGSAAAVITNIHYCCGTNTYESMYIIPTSESPTVHNCMPWESPPACSSSGYAFRIQVINSDPGYTFATCQINGSALMPCTVDIPIDNFWPVTYPGYMAGSSYVIAGTQTSAGAGLVPVYSCPSCLNGMWVSGLWLGF